MWGDLLFAWGGLVVQPVVGVGIGVGDVVGFRVLGGVGVAEDGEGEVRAVGKGVFTDFCDGIRDDDGNQGRRTGKRRSINCSNRIRDRNKR